MEFKAPKTNDIISSMLGAHGGKVVYINSTTLHSLYGVSDLNIFLKL